MARILSVSYDELLLRTRHMLLQQAGYEVVSSLGFTESLQHCKQGNVDLFILGHSIPYSDKQQLVESFRGVCPAPIISLRRNLGEQLVEGANHHIEPDPEPLLDLVDRILSGKAATS
jgi:DNA-binding response OmpR family regulator